MSSSRMNAKRKHGIHGIHSVGAIHFRASSFSIFNTNIWRYCKFISVTLKISKKKRRLNSCTVVHDMLPTVISIDLNKSTSMYLSSEVYSDPMFGFK